METTFKINDFEGPLDLLLHLIKENKMDIFDIELTTLTAQYLEVVEQAKKINLEIASDFLVMAATLVELKSKLLLPKPEIEIEDEYEINNEEKLIKRLLEYKKYKEVVGTFKDYHESRKLLYSKPLEDLTKYKSDENVVDFDENIEIYDLIKSMDKIYKRLKYRQPMNSSFKNTEISVEVRCETLLEQIDKLAKKNILFDELIDIPTRSYAIVTFLALLDLAKRNKIKVRQSKNFDNIYINGVV